MMTARDLAIKHVRGDEDRNLRRLLKQRPDDAPAGTPDVPPRVVTMAPLAVEQYRLLYRFDEARTTDIRGVPLRKDDRYVVIRTLWQRNGEEWAAVDWTSLQTVRVTETSDAFGPIGPSRPGRFGENPEVGS